MFKIVTSCIGYFLLFLFISPVQAQYVGLDFYRNLSDLPTLYPDIEACYVSSYDRTGGNDDGFNGTYSELYVDDNGEHVIFEEDGPGCIYNIWFTGSGRSLHWGRIKFYFDGEDKPRINFSPEELFGGQNPPFVYPLVTHNFISSGGFSSSAPIPFSEHLKITTEKKVGFYNMYYHLHQSKTVPSWTGKENYDHIISLFESCGSDPKEAAPVEVVSKTVRLAAKTSPREEITAELFKSDRGGTIQYIKINPLYRPDQYNLNHIYLNISFDDQSELAVHVPIGPFFGSGLGETEVKGLFVGMTTSGSYYCYFPMPFEKSARVTLENTSRESGGEFFYEIGYTPGDPFKDRENSPGYFGAEYRKDWPITEVEDYVLFDYEGKGAVVGQVMTVEPVKPDIKRWWEGDMHIFIDGEKKPVSMGQGMRMNTRAGGLIFG